jgi:hypothetical protein
MSEVPQGYRVETAEATRRPPLPVGVPKAINAPMSRAEWTEAPAGTIGR